MPLLQLVPTKLRSLAAIEAYKAHEDLRADIACRSIGCRYRNDDGSGSQGYCGACADRRALLMLRECA